MANDIANQICDAVDLLIGNRVSSLQFDKTVRATILSVEDQSIGKYRVKYQNSIFYAYSDPDQSYRPNTEVYVEIPSNDYNKDKVIIGSVKKIGTQYLAAVSAQGRMTKIGTNILTNKKGINFCSYSGRQTNNLLNDQVTVNATDLSIYKTDALYFMLGATVQTALPVEQQVGGGNYGIILQVDYYTTAEKESLGNNRSTITRTYVLDVNNMLGQPYKYLLPDKQYAIFEIDGNNLKGIKSIQAFCEGFPVTKTGQPNDIFLSDIEISFMEALTPQELSTSSLKILTPYGSYFTSLNDDTKYLEAELKLKGKIVNFNEQNVDFYWFVKDTGIFATNQLYYSPYAGEGWRCLNKSQTYGGLTQFIPEGYRKHITIDLAPAAVTTFKCVAVYNDTTLSATIQMQNRVAKTSINITSSAGTQFYFDTGKTTLTCNVTTDQTGLKYFWGYRTADGEFVSLPDKTKSIDINIQIATSFITYECTVYKGATTRLGSAEITLTNGVPENEYTLVINNGTQIFKYDEYGVSPASNAAAAADRIIIPTLSFDIYNDLGQLVTPVDDAEKIRLCDIKWIWPDEDYTMLQHATFNLADDLIVNPTTNGNVLRRVLVNSATLTFEIKNRFDIDATDNNIQLEVSFQGHNLVASTNFTFTKDGELGTNGTQYVSRLVPINNNFRKIYLQNGKVYGWNQTVSKKYNSTSGKYDVTDSFVFTEITSKRPLKSQLWDGAATALYDSQTNTSSIDADLSWEIVDVGAKTTHNATVAANGTITPGTSYLNVSTVVKTTLQTSELSELSRYYYATYPLDVSKTPKTTTHAIVVGGFNECMYNSDGTRSAFNTKPFTLRIFKQNNVQQIVNEANLTWTVSWYDSRKNQALRGHNGVSIEPPSFFDSTTTNNYIRINYTDADGQYIIILSVHLYLNRYGLAAMNDWDGTSIKINQSGDQYILAPQIGAGKKQTNNTFTGVTMGKSFNVNGNASDPEVGLMGFNKGIRSIFLDAQTGRAMFGAANSSQIVISPQKYGIAPSGSIYSWNYYNCDTTGKPTSKRNQGLLIDLDEPSILFGSGNFSVDKNGHLVAKGGGTIAGWNITDNYLQSVDKKTTLYSQNGPTAKDASGNAIRQRFNIGNGKFIIYDDGTFKAANDKFAVSQDGTITSIAGKIGGWTISRDSLSANGITISSNGNIKGDNWQINRGDATFNNITANGTGHIGGWTISSYALTGGGIELNSGGSMRGPQWNISADGVATFTDVRISSGNGTSTLNWGSNFSVDGGGNLIANSGLIGGWNLSSTGFSGNGISFTSGGGLSLGSGFSVNAAGVIASVAGQIGGWNIDGGSLSGGGTTMSSNGTITCSNLIATQSGQIGGCTISGGTLTADGLRLNGAGWQTITFVSAINSINVYKQEMDVVTQISRGSDTATLTGRDSQGGQISVSGNVPTVSWDRKRLNSITGLSMPITLTSINVLGGQATTTTTKVAQIVNGTA